MIESGDAEADGAIDHHPPVARGETRAVACCALSPLGRFVVGLGQGRAEGGRHSGVRVEDGMTVSTKALAKRQAPGLEWRPTGRIGQAQF